MAYNLPPPWTAGYALPENVVDEGLERRAFITKMMPRGSYDDPAVGDGGYDVPQYIKDEGYGQGAFTTDWQPDGTYNGPRVPNWLNRRPQVVRTQRLPGGGRQVTVQPLGDAPMPEPFETYGQRAAAGLIARVATLPTSQRASAMKGILDAVDRSIWPRTQEIFARYRKQGMAPADAFRMALARSMSTGIAAEIVTTGARRSAPQAKSLLGLGCYGRAAVLGAMGLGDTPPPAAAPGSTPAPSTTPISTARCDPAPGFTWVEATPTVAGHWERLRKGMVPQKGPCDPTTGATAAPIVTDHRQVNDFFVGPFGFANAALRDGPWKGLLSSPDILYLSPDPNFELPPSSAAQGSPVRSMSPLVLQWLSTRLREAKDANGKTDVPRHYNEGGDTKEAFFSRFGEDADRWFSAMGITPDMPLRMHVLTTLRTGSIPWLGVKTEAGRNMLLRMQLAPVRWDQPHDPTSNPLVLKVWLSDPPSGDFWDKITHALSNPLILVSPLAAAQATAQITSASLDYLSDLSCDVLKDPNGKAAAQAGASAVAAYYGMPPETGAKGVDIAANACGVTPPPPPPMVVPKSVLPIVLLAGGAVTAVYLLTRKKKKP